MAATSSYDERRTAIYLLRSGVPPTDVAKQLHRSLPWVYKWYDRFRVQQRWDSLNDRSRAPKAHPTRLSLPERQAIIRARSELEAEAAQPGHLNYIGAHAVQNRLRRQGVRRLPSISSIERTLAAAGMTRPHKPAPPPVVYPHLHPVHPLQLIQADIVPHFLPGGACVACFNAIDVASKYPTGKQYPTKRSADAANFLIHVWQEIGIPQYTQVDNEACFSGGFSHPAVLGNVLRLALLVGTELVFSPFRHPESNASVERFHQDYNAHVWHKVELSHLEHVRQHSTTFFELYHQSGHHSALNGRSPAQVHRSHPGRRLPEAFTLPANLPLTAGRVHFIRQVSQHRTIPVLNVNWNIPQAEPGQGVWATLEITLTGASLKVYDAPPDATKRTCLAKHPFALKEPVQPLHPRFWPPTPRGQSRLGRLAHIVQMPLASSRVRRSLSTMF
jgi:transposase InsO family protein